MEYIVFDEFINTNPMSKMKNELMLLMNAIETVNRNREFNSDGTVDNSKSVKVIMLSNANTLDDDILRTLNIPEVIRQMKINDEHVYIEIYSISLTSGIIVDSNGSDDKTVNHIHVIAKEKY